MEQNDRTIETYAGKVNPFAVPEGYFDQLSEQIAARVAINSALSKSTGSFEVPSGYFEELPARIESAVFAETLREKIAGEGFEVPSGYFADLPGRITGKVTAPKRSMKLIQLSWIRYAAAACITLLIGVTLILNGQKDGFDEQLAAIPEQEIVHYLQVNSEPGDTEFIKQNVETTNGLTEENLSDAAIEDYLKNTL